MMNFAGKKRVIINNILPTANNGLFPAKTIINVPVIISANAFTDGHDEIAVVILVKQKKDKQWKQFSMLSAYNDRWQFAFTPSLPGLYQFQVQAWVDHFTTWQKGLSKKYQANQDLAVELQIGAQIAEDAAKRATGKTKDELDNWMRALQSAANIESAVNIALSEKTAAIINSINDKAYISESEIYNLEAEPPKAQFSTWYELFPRSAAAEPGRHGTFSDVKKLLPRVAEMGFDVLYFPPIHPIGEVNRKGRNNSLSAGENDPGSPWAIGNKAGGHKAIHSELGSLDDFRDLVSDAKSRGIDIALDIAFQCAPDHPYVSQHPQWFKWRPDGTVQYAENPPKRYEDILPFNFETDDWEALWTELKSVVMHWVDNGVEIFRVDNPHTKSFSFWEWMIAEIKNTHPQVIFLAEAFTRPRIMERLAMAGFTQSYTYFTWRNSKKELETYVTELTKTDLKYYFRPNFWPNTPDILSEELVHGNENAHIMRLLLAATLSSNYGLYGPVYEFGINEPMPGKEEYIDNEKYEIKHWDWNRYTRIKEIITLINRIRKENAALHSTCNIEFAETNNDQLICYLKADPDRTNILIVVVNLDPFNTQQGEVKVPLYKLDIDLPNSYQVRDLLSGDKYEWNNEWNFVSLNPGDMPAHVLRIEL